MITLSQASKRIIKSTLITFSVIIAIILLSIILVYHSYIKNQTEEYNRVANVIKPVFTKIQKKYDNAIVLTDDNGRGLYYWEFQYNKMVSINDDFETSIDICNQIDNYLKSSSDVKKCECLISIRWPQKDSGMSFSTIYDEQCKKKIGISGRVDVNILLKSLEKVDSLYELSVDYDRYSENDLRIISNWCKENNIVPYKV